MRKLILIACAALAARETCAQFASGVVNYTPGSNPASGANLPDSALGEPSRFTEHQFGGPVDPFNPAFLNTQIVSVGAGGSLTLHMGAPVMNDPGNPCGIDFIIYGNAGLGLNFTTGQADGTLFGSAAPGNTRVSVSSDNLTYFSLDLSLAPMVDSYFPTDGSGLFGRAVDPALANGAAFNGLTLPEIRALYDGSAGGAGFDLAWARDGGGQPVSLDSVNYIRVEVFNTAAEIDGISAVPEPSTWALLGLGASAILLRKRRS